MILARTLVGAAFKPARLELTYPAPKNMPTRTAGLFRCEVRFGASRNRVVVETALARLRIADAHHPVSAQQALDVLPRAGGPDQEAERDRRVGRANPAPPPRRAADASPKSRSSLNLSQRNLRRHLSAVGQGYRDIHDRMRIERAMELLSAGALSIADIGSEVGFSDAREFRRAFKRWTGSAPAAAVTKALADRLAGSSDAGAWPKRPDAVGRFAPHAVLILPFYLLGRAVAR